MKSALFRKPYIVHTRFKNSTKIQYAKGNMKNSDNMLINETGVVPNFNKIYYNEIVKDISNDNQVCAATPNKFQLIAYETLNIHFLLFKTANFVSAFLLISVVY